MSADRPLRILQVIPSLGEERGGPIQVVKEMCRALAARGCEIELHATDAGPRGTRLPAEARDIDLGPSVRLHLHRADLLAPPYLSTAMLLALARASRRADLAHVHTCFNAPASTAMWLFRRGPGRMRIPYVLRTCGMLDGYSLGQHALRKRLWLDGLERANVVHASLVQVSTPLEEREVRRALPTAKTLVLPQGVAPPSPPGPRPHPRPYLLFLSRVARKKGLLRLVSAFALLLERLSAHPLGEALDLVIAGPDEDHHRGEVEAHIAAHSSRLLARRVAFVGPVSGARKSAWFAHAEAFVLPSDDENFGVVVIESAHLGTPVLVSDAVGLADAVARHGAGLVLPRTPEAWADGLEAVLARGRESFARGTAALAADFDWGELAQRLEARYRSLIAPRTG